MMMMMMGSRWDSIRFFLCFFRECTSSPGSLCPESAWVRSTWKRRSRQNPRVTVTLWYGLWWPLFSLGGCLEKGQSGWHQLLIYGGLIWNRCFHFPSIFFNFNLEVSRSSTFHQSSEYFAPPNFANDSGTGRTEIVNCFQSSSDSESILWIET